VLFGSFTFLWGFPPTAWLSGFHPRAADRGGWVEAALGATLKPFEQGS
jgi:hypothetical protein